MSLDRLLIRDIKPLGDKDAACGCSPALSPEKEQPCCDAPEKDQPCCGAPEKEQSCCGAPEKEQSCCDAPEKDQPCCGAPAIKIDWAPPSTDLAFVEDEIDTPLGKVPRVSTKLTFTDHMGTARARWGFGRMDYGVPPGLYALGSPDSESEVIVTANYKLTFDKVRSTLNGQNLWIVVLDTMAVNVWCAAGKGTFGTQELIQRLSSVELDRIVVHRRIILPQLGAPGVAAHTVKKNSGFKVVYGPVCVDDLPDFLKAGRKATPQMRQKDFPLSERAVLIPIELVSAFKALLVMAAAFFFISGFGGPGDYWTNALHSGLLAVLALVCVVVGGAILTPLLLPWLPGRAFSVKSLPVALVLISLVILWRGGDMSEWSSMLEAGAWLLIVPSLSAYFAINFTGASTYTSLSGVEKEMRIAMPMQIVAASIGLILWIGSRIAA